MKIVKFTAENVKRLKAVEITPDGNLQVVAQVAARAAIATMTTKEEA